MTINFKRNFCDFSGNESTEQMSDTIAKLLYIYGSRPEDNATPDRKYQAWKIMTKMTSYPSQVELTAEDAAFLKEICGRGLYAGAYGQVVELIEGE